MIIQPIICRSKFYIIMHTLAKLPDLLGWTFWSVVFFVDKYLSFFKPRWTIIFQLFHPLSNHFLPFFYRMPNSHKIWHNREKKSAPSSASFLRTTFCLQPIISHWLLIVVIWVVKFPRVGYKSKYILDPKSTYSK